MISTHNTWISLQPLPPWSPVFSPKPLLVLPQWPENGCELPNPDASLLCSGPPQLPPHSEEKPKPSPTAHKALLTLLQPRGPPCCSSDTPGMILPQGLCTGCFLSLEHSSPSFDLTFSLLIPVSAQISVLRSPTPVPVTTPYRVAPPGHCFSRSSL